jgi:hypothetical protein
MANWSLKDIVNDGSRAVCMHCGETFTLDECPRWDCNGFEVSDNADDFEVRLCRECADKHFYPELYTKPATGINHTFIVENDMEADLSEIRNPVVTRSTNHRKRNSYSGLMLQAMEAYDIAHGIWSEYCNVRVSDERFEIGVNAFIKMNELMGKIRSKKNLAILRELHYNIAWEYMHHPLFTDWENSGRQ